ncbi:AAA family ATPase [Polynucleobacter paneuropaeus]|nr:AAA family ATPase [Polynucleobacter paneuropaeus]
MTIDNLSPRLEKVKPSNLTNLEHSTLESRKLEIHTELKAPAYVVDGIIPEGVGVIAGSAGIGKTTGIIPLAAVVAGFSSHLSDIKAKRRRHVIVLTEDDAQVSRLLVGITEWMLLDSGQKVTIDDIAQWIHLYSSKRLTSKNLRQNLEEIMGFDNTMMTSHGETIAIPPLVIIDTAAANFELNNENANAEISGFMAVLKEMHTKTRMNIWVIAHLAKTAKGISIDEMDTLSARGGGAWEADANWTAVLSADDDGKRILKMNKRRVEIIFTEIYFQSITHSKSAQDEFGDAVNLEYRYVTPMRSDYNSRIAKKMKPIEDEVLKVVGELEWPSKNEIQNHMGGKSTKIKSVIDSLIKREKLKIQELPVEVTKKGRRDYIAIPAD